MDREATSDLGTWRGRIIGLIGAGLILTTAWLPSVEAPYSLTTSFKARGGRNSPMSLFGMLIPLTDQHSFASSLMTGFATICRRSLQSHLNLLWPAISSTRWPVRLRSRQTRTINSPGESARSCQLDRKALLTFSGSWRPTSASLEVREAQAELDTPAIPGTTVSIRPHCASAYGEAAFAVLAPQ
jgi:hypothetical protein